jgi:long-chain acyl-CoA synthetase
VIYERFAYWGRVLPAVTAIRTAQQRLTYGQALRWVDAIAGRFRAQGVRPGHRVAVPDTEVAEQLCQFALDRLGACSCKSARNASWVDGVVAHEGQSGEKMLDMGPLAPPAPGDATALAEAALPPHAWQPGDSARIRPSSGSTGKRKWIHRSYESTVRGLEINRFLMRFGPGMVCAHGLGGAGPGAALKTNAWATGSTLAVLTPVGPQESATPSLQLLDELGVQELAISPGTLQLMLSSGSPARKLPGLRIYFYGSRAPAKLVERVANELTTFMMGTYGSTESSNAMAGLLDPANPQPHSIGHVLPSARVQVVGADGSPAPTGTTGLLRLQIHDPLHDGYVGEDGVLHPFNPADPSWFEPGDLGWIDEGGALHVIGRGGDILNLGGLKMHASELEDALQATECTAEQAALEIVSEDGASKPVAVVVLKPGASIPQLRQAMRDKLPQVTGLGIVAVPGLPRLETAKVDYQEIRRRLLSLQDRK